MDVYFVTDNQGKVKEAKAILGKWGIGVKQLSLEKLEIQDDDVSAIVLYSIKDLMKRHEGPLMVEDAGLHVQVLSGFPGPYSSYVYRTIGIEGILKLLEGVIDRRAYFRSAIAYYDNDVGIQIFTGQVHGTISEKPRGDKGFGFDPIFIPSGRKKTFAEMELDEKSRISHRGKALRRLAHWLRHRVQKGK
jgi:XTP/dITP diphosphohydrolase